MLKSLRFQLEFHFFPNNPLKFRRGKVSPQVNIPETHIKVLCSQNVIWGPRRAAPGLTASPLVLRWHAPFSPPGFHTHSAASRSFVPETESLNTNGKRTSGSTKHDTEKPAKQGLFSLWKVILRQIPRFTSNRTITTIFKSYVLEIPLY